METEHKWVTITEAYTELEAEIIRGLFEAQGIQVLLPRASGHVFRVEVGLAGHVDIMVPSHQFALAQQILAEYEANEFQDADLLDVEPDESAPGDEEEDQG